MRSAERVETSRAILQDVLLSMVLALPIYALWHGTLHLGATAIDLSPTFVAGRLYATGHEAAVYQAELWTHGELSPLWRAVMEQHHIARADSTYVYGPAYLWSMLPAIVCLSWQQFRLAWLVAAAAAAAFSGVSCMVLAGRTGWAWRLLGAGLAAISFGSYYGAALGQNVLHALALLLFGYRLYVRAGHAAGLAPLLLALLFKPWLALLSPVLWWLGRVRGFITLAVAYALAQFALPFCFARPLFQGYLGTLDRLRSASLVDFNNVALRAFIHRSVWPLWPHYASSYTVMTLPLTLYSLEYVVLGCFALLTVAIAIKLRPGGYAVMSGSLCLLVATLGICWTHYLLLILPASIRLTFSQHTSPRLRAVGVLAVSMLLLPWQWVSRWLPPLDVAHGQLWSALLLVPWLIAASTGFAALAAPDVLRSPRARVE